VPRPKTTKEQDKRGGRLTDRLDAAREEQDLTLVKLAERSGLNYNTTKALLNRRAPRAQPDFFLIAALADALHLSLDTLATEVARPPATRRSRK
jgi:transcriptional regulator with XRE-family HTH domain